MWLSQLDEEDGDDIKWLRWKWTRTMRTRQKALGTAFAARPPHPPFHFHGFEGKARASHPLRERGLNLNSSCSTVVIATFLLIKRHVRLKAASGGFKRGGGAFKHPRFGTAEVLAIRGDEGLFHGPRAPA